MRSVCPALFPNLLIHSSLNSGVRARTGFESLRSIHSEDPQLLKDIEVYIDGGIRRGTDVLQAIAFGARGVGLGRPFLWAQAAYGEKGVIRAVRSEFRARVGKATERDVRLINGEINKSWKARSSWR